LADIDFQELCIGLKTFSEFFQIVMTELMEDIIAGAEVIVVDNIL
jgi:hypothetical protein